MKEFLVLEKTKEYGSENYKCKIFSTKEEAIKYLEERNKNLYYNYNVEYWLKEDKENTKYDKAKDIVFYNDGYRSYDIAIYEL